MKKNKIALCILAKYPSAGNVKTRLAKNINPDRAVNLYYKLLVNTINQVKSTNVYNDIFIISSDLKNKNSLEIMFLNNSSIIFYKEKSLNFLLKRIFKDFIFEKNYNKVLVTCSDSPFITPNLIQEAYNVLENENSLFISPSSDGGYSLVGMNKFVDIFSSVVMSTDKVLNDTLKIAKLSDLKIFISNEVDDIDTIDDVYRLRNKITDKHDPLGLIRKELMTIN